MIKQKIFKDPLYNYIYVDEDINMQNIVQSLKLGKSTNDNGFGMFRRKT